MKTRIRTYALPLIMSATLVIIAGCATHGKPPPTITLDEPVAAHLLPEAPKPIEVVMLPEPLALPAQLKSLPVDADAKSTPEAADEKVRVSRANLDARVAPSRDRCGGGTSRPCLHETEAAPGLRSLASQALSARGRRYEGIALVQRALDLAVARAEARPHPLAFPAEASDADASRRAESGSLLGRYARPRPRFPKRPRLDLRT